MDASSVLVFTGGGVLAAAPKAGGCDVGELVEEPGGCVLGACPQVPVASFLGSTGQSAEHLAVR